MTSVGQQFLDPRVQRSGMRVGHHGNARRTQKPGEPLHIGQRIKAHRPAMVRQRAAVPAALDRFDRHHFERAQTGIAGIVKQHGDILVELLRDIEAGLHMARGIGVGKLDPRNAADHIGAKRHGLLHQRERARLANDAVLGERDDLQIDNAAEFVADPDKRLDAFETRLAINVGKSANVQVAVERRQRHGAAGVFDDPGLRVFLFDLTGELDAGHRLAHRLALIGLERLLLHHRQGPDLAQMQVRIDE